MPDAAGLATAVDDARHLLLLPLCQIPDRLFEGKSWFSGTTFDGDTDFSGAVFTGAATFYGAHFYEMAEFQPATFAAEAMFATAIFDGSAWFSSSAFGGRASFGGARFTGDVTFQAVTFGGATEFTRATFSYDQDRPLFVNTRVLVDSAQHVWPTGWQALANRRGQYVLARNKAALGAPDPPAPHPV